MKKTIKIICIVLILQMTIISTFILNAFAIDVNIEHNECAELVPMMARDCGGNMNSHSWTEGHGQTSKIGCKCGAIGAYILKCQNCSKYAYKCMRCGSIKEG